MAFTLNLADRSVSTQLPALIMGIVNCTPDSFYASSRACGKNAVDYALSLVEQGADILDIGGESTRPGSGYVDEAEEMGRVLPVIEGIRKECSVPISVDTRKLSVFRAAWSSGADILNDVSALEDDPGMARFVAEKKCPVILMHKRGTPRTMQEHASYTDVLGEVDRYLRARALYAAEQGIMEDRIIVDPGIGFGKNLAANGALIAGCGSLCGGRYPVLMALSRKTCTGLLALGTESCADGSEPLPADCRLYATLAADIVAVQAGASLVRVHDVSACRQSLNVLENIKRCM